MGRCPSSRPESRAGGASRAPLVLACGNPSRGDDALGPALVERLTIEAGIDADLLCDFQLQIEHVLDLEGRSRVVFVDAAMSGPEPFAFTSVVPEPGTLTTHAMSPGGLISVYHQVARAPAPACWLLAIRGYSFGLGDGISARAESNLGVAAAFLMHWLRCGYEGCGSATGNKR